MRTSSKISQYTPNTTLIHPKPTLYPPCTHQPLHNLAKKKTPFSPPNTEKNYLIFSNFAQLWGHVICFLVNLFAQTYSEIKTARQAEQLCFTDFFA